MEIRKSGLRNKYPLVFIAVIGLLFGVAQPASAAIYSGTGIQVPTDIKIYRPAYSGDWEQAAIMAIPAWNGVGNSSGTVKATRVFSKGSLTPTMTIQSYTFDHLGDYTRVGDLGNFRIRVNTRTIQLSSTTTNRQKYARSVIAHEIGHALNLSDNPGGSSTSSLMNYSRNRATLYIPQTIDKTRVTNWYF